MAFPTYRYAAVNRGSSATPLTVSVDLGGGSAPNDSDLLLAVWFDSSEGATTITASHVTSGWSFGGSGKSEPGGTTGTRQSQVAWATRAWASGDPTTVEPFAPTLHNNWAMYVFVLSGAGFVEGIATAHSVGTTASTGTLSFDADGEFLLIAGAVFPRSTVSGASTLPNPPFTGLVTGAIGTGFSNYNGVISRGNLEDETFGPYATHSSTEASAAFLIAIASAEPVALPDRVVADAGDRLRSSISETTGSLLQAVDVRAVDASVNEAYALAQALQPSILTNFRELTRERDSTTVDVAYYPRPRQNLLMENQYDGVTVLSRLARYYPPRVFDSVGPDGLAIVLGEIATAQQVITHVLSEWATDTGWLTYAPVPDLRLRLPGFSPSDYSSTRHGRVVTRVLAIPQDKNNRKNALDILQDLLSPFPGTLVRQNSAGELEIVPTYGPDADETPHRTLTTLDAYSVTIGNPDPFSTINRATVSSSGYARADDVPIMQPAWFQVGGRVQFGRTNWFSPPVDRVNLQPFEDDTADTLQETLSTSEADPRAAQKPVLWPVSTTNIPAGSGISLLDSVGDPVVTHAWARYFNDSLVDSGTETGNLTFVTPVIPFSGAWVTAIRFFRNIGSFFSIEPVRVDVLARWDEARGGVEFRFENANLETDRSTGTNGVIIEFTLNDSSVGYAETNPVSGTFGFLENEDSLPAADGGNAIEDSQLEFGVVERDITVRGYVLDGSTAAQVARAYVLENITPKVTREVDLSVVGSTLVLFDDIGRLVELPNGDVGFVEGVGYSDDFVGRGWRKTATVGVRDLAAAGAVDPTTVYLLNDDDSLWQNDDASFSEEF